MVVILIAFSKKSKALQLKRGAIGQKGGLKNKSTKITLTALNFHNYSVSIRQKVNFFSTTTIFDTSLNVTLMSAKGYTKIGTTLPEHVFNW